MILVPKRRKKRSFLWQFPLKKEGSSVPDTDYFNILADETIKLELEIVSIHEKFKNVQPTEMAWSKLSDQLNQGTHAYLLEDEFFCCNLNVYSQKGHLKNQCLIYPNF